MDKFDRIQQLHRLFSARRKPVSLSIIAENLECSERNARRLITLLQDRMFAPLEQDKQTKGWFYNSHEEFELPGMWLTQEEQHSLSLLLDILSKFGDEALGKELKPIKKTIYRLLESRGINPSTFDTHIKVLPLGNRQLTGKIFNQVSEALLYKKCLSIDYKSYQHAITKRTISPQNLIYYRENWYLDAWCHLRKALRTFSISRIEKANISNKPCKVIAQMELEAHFADSYGIFSGKGKHLAKLRFSKTVAREVSTQQWHPDQRSEWDGNEYLLSFTYSSDKELIQDLLRYTPNVTVEAPYQLRKALQDKLQQGLELCLGRGLGWLK